MAKKRLCAVCGSEYSFCPNCGNTTGNETWRYLFDGEDCMSIYHIYDKHRAGKITDDVAKNELEKYDLSKVLEADTLVAKSIKDLFNKKNEPSINIEKEDAAVTTAEPSEDNALDDKTKENNGHKKNKYVNKK